MKPYELCGCFQQSKLLVQFLWGMQVGKHARAWQLAIRVSHRASSCGSSGPIPGCRDAAVHPKITVPPSRKGVTEPEEPTQHLAGLALPNTGPRVLGTMASRWRRCDG